MILLLLCAASPSAGAAGDPQPFDRSHALFDALLAKHVEAGRVDYRRLTDHPQPLDEYLALLASLPPAALQAMPRSDQLAYWINAYNAFALKSVVEHYPLRRRGIVGLVFPANSIWQIAGVWKNRRWRAAGQTLSLDQIEHDIIRPVFKEPRSHFVLVCASTSCPDLGMRAYRGDALERQLNEQTRRFLHDPRKGVRIDAAAGTIHVSKIFDWFADDFALSHPSEPNHPGLDREESGVLSFIASHRTDSGLQRLLRESRIEVEFLPYDWTLNDRVGP
jgi:hypothetical protein